MSTLGTLARELYYSLQFPREKRMPRVAALSKSSLERAAAYETRRMDILHKAALAFAEDGYHQTSVKSLAARLGVSKPVLYYYAKNKDDLLFQCYKVAREALLAAIEDATRSNIRPIDKIRRFFAEYAEIMCGDFGRCLALVDRKALSPATRRKDALLRRELEETLRKMIREGQADKSIALCDPILTARALFGAFNGIPRWFRADGALKAGDVADGYMDLFIRGIGR
jgi:TetR/AcrR family transcriptional regulator, cholesterol catabolism regulator